MEVKHTNKIAIKILRNEYSDYDINPWHYTSEYKMIVKSQELILSQAKTTVWIDVKVELPAMSKIDGSRDNIIVSTKSGKVFCTKYTALGWANLYGEEVTHWMLLPDKSIAVA